MLRNRRGRRGRREYLAPGHIGVDHYVGNERNVRLVLLPGLGAEGKVFVPVARRLQELGLTCTILELPGSGYRHPADSRVSVTKAAETLIESQILPDGPIVYVGHSAGGMQAIEAAKLDDRAVGVVLLNAVLDHVSDVIHQPWRHAWRHPVKAVSLASLLVFLKAPGPEWLVRRYERPRHPLTLTFWPMIARPWRLSAEDLRCLMRHGRCPGAWKALIHNRHYDLASHASEVKVPMLVVCGKRDPLGTKPHQSRFLAACEARTDVLEIDCGHCSTLEAPEEVAQALMAFVTSLAA